MNIVLRKAQRASAKIKMAITGASGAGKTYSALVLAKGLASSMDKVAVIDTENGSADLYANLGNYNVITLGVPFSPEKYIEAINECNKAGMEVIIIDSISHEWDGPGGCLDLVEQYGGKYQDWAKVTPRHQKFFATILSSPAHVIATMRKKQDYDMIKGGDGRVKVEKVGLKSIARDGSEYEFTIVFDIDMHHMARVDKDRTGIFNGQPIERISEKTGRIIKEWCESGSPSVQEVLPSVSTIAEATNITIDIKEEKGNTAVALEKQVEEKELKKRIKELCDTLSGGNLTDVTEYKNFVLQTTKLELVPHQYGAIITSLNGILNKSIITNDK